MAGLEEKEDGKGHPSVAMAKYLLLRYLLDVSYRPKSETDYY